MSLGSEGRLASLASIKFDITPLIGGRQAVGDQIRFGMLDRADPVKLCSVTVIERFKDYEKAVDELYTGRSIRTHDWRPIVACRARDLRKLTADLQHRRWHAVPHHFGWWHLLNSPGL